MVSALVCACLSAGQSAIVGSMTPIIDQPDYRITKRLVVNDGACKDLKNAKQEFINLVGITCKES